MHLMSVSSRGYPSEFGESIHSDEELKLETSVIEPLTMAG